MKKYETACNKCNATFVLSELNTNLKERLPDNVQRYYIECPNCKEQYTSYYTNPTIRALQDRLRKVLRTQAPNSIGAVSIERKIFAEHKLLKEKIESSVLH